MAGPEINSQLQTLPQPQKDLLRVTAIWDINEQGRAENCRVTGTSGNTDLDEATCSLIIRRARYKAALDQSGQPTRSQAKQTWLWQLPK